MGLLTVLKIRKRDRNFSSSQVWAIPDGNTQKQSIMLVFCVIDRLAEKYHIDVTKFKQKALIGDGTINGKRVLLVKPQTFMNLSGGKHPGNR